MTDRKVEAKCCMLPYAF